MKRKRQGSDDEDEESSEDERIFEEPVNDFVEENVQEDEDEDFFENSQDLTQVVPRSRKEETLPLPSPTPSPKKNKEKKKNRQDFRTEGHGHGHGHSSTNSVPAETGYRLREVDVSEIPEHILKNLKRLQPTKTDCLEGFTPEEIKDQDGIWILKCPREARLSSILTGKKLSLNKKRTILKCNEHADEFNLTQYMPTNSLGSNIKDRQYEAVTVSNDDSKKEGAVLLLPEGNIYKLVAAPVQGHIIIRESVEEMILPKLEVPFTIPRELPSGIKERHPVYGSDFTQILKEMEEAPVKKKKKKKKSSLEPEPKPELSTYPKRNINGHLDNGIDTDAHDEYSTPKKKKKKKVKQESEEEQERYNYSNNKLSFSAKMALVEEPAPSKSKKKSKKRKHDEIEEGEDSKEHLLLSLNGYAPPGKKSKKSKHRE